MSVFSQVDYNRLSSKLELLKGSDNVRSIKVNTASKDKDYYFQDGLRKIDFVLVYSTHVNKAADTTARRIVNAYLANLDAAGIELEVNKSVMEPETTLFIKVHCPLSILYRYSFELNIPLEMDNINVLYLKEMRGCGVFHNILTLPKVKDPVYSRAEQTLSQEMPSEPTSAERILIVDKILKNMQFKGEDHELPLGYRSLIIKKYLTNAFPMHDGICEWTEEGPLNDRQLLAKYWASFHLFYKSQPLDLINKYFGTAVAFYFAWMEFYNKVLVVMAGLGMITLIYGILTIDTSYNAKGQSFCKSGETVCARCEDFAVCKFYHLNRTCQFANITHLIENHGMIAYAVIFSLWSTVLIKLWQRREKILAYRWNVLKEQADLVVRPQYLENSKYRRVSSITGELEAYTPWQIKMFRSTVSMTIILIMTAAVIITSLAVVSYRLWMERKGVSVTEGIDHSLEGYLSLISELCVSVITLGIIMIFDTIFACIAERLTDFEDPKTDAQYTKSLTKKIFVFSFINGFAPLIYIALAKGRAYQRPGIQYGSIMSYYATDYCDVYGCIIDICSQLIFILIGTWFLHSLKAFIIPCAMTRIKTRSIRRSKIVPAWEYEYHCSQPSKNYLMFEYKTIVLQYGYLTMFSAAFPLSPLLAVMYNTLQIRADAYKMIRVSQRPIPFKVNGIGLWNTCMKVITVVSIVTNAFIIAFTTDFVWLEVKHCGMPKDAVSRLFSLFATKDYPQWGLYKDQAPVTNLEHCIYRGIKHPPESPEKYTANRDSFCVTAMQLIFFMILEHFLFFITAIMAYSIDNLPRIIKDRLNIEKLSNIKAAITDYQKTEKTQIDKNSSKRKSK